MEARSRYRVAPVDAVSASNVPRASSAYEDTFDLGMCVNNSVRYDIMKLRNILFLSF